MLKQTVRSGVLPTTLRKMHAKLFGLKLTPYTISKLALILSLYNTFKMRTFTLKVVDLIFETTDTLTVSFKQPALKKVKYLAGQYLTLIVRVNGRRYIRPYSFSSAPGVDATLDVTIKRVPGGVVSNHVIDTLKVDDLVEVMEPMGDFVVNEGEVGSDTHIVLWGAGSGITPLMSIAKYALHNNIAGHVTLVYGNRNNESVIFADKINQLAALHSNRFSAWHFYTQPTITSDDPYHVQGRIAPAKVLSVMQEEGRLDNTLHYICGPAGLKASVKGSLIQLGLGPDRVFAEDFEVVRDPKDFEDIITRTVTLNVDGITANVEVVKGKSILEAGLDGNIEMPYSCQTGNCLVCKGRVVRGDVKMIGVDKFPNGLLPGETLLCSSFPLTDDIAIEIV